MLFAGPDVARLSIQADHIITTVDFLKHCQPCHYDHIYIVASELKDPI